MRVTSSMYYNNLYSSKNDSLQSKLFDVNKQIASGLQIQYAKDGVRTFAETMRLDNEIAGLSQVSKSASNGYKLSNQTDVILNEFDSTMARMRVLLIKAANASNSDVSLDAIAQELRTVEKHFYNLANSSINGQYLFSGSAIDTPPIDDNGIYQGNNVELHSFTGTKTKQQYNITGEELFLGEKHLVKRQVTSNVVNNNLIYDLAGTALAGTPTEGDIGVVTKDSTIRQLMGDTDASDGATATPTINHFYVRGTKSDGTSFTTDIQMIDIDPISSLLGKIEDVYGTGLVDVSMNAYGEFVIQDKIKGSSRLDFNMVGAVDFDLTDNGGRDDADISAAYPTPGLITNIDNGETDFNKIANGTSVAGNTNLHVKQFIKSDLNSASAISTLAIDGLQYDRTEFTTDGSTATSNVSQIVKRTRIIGTTEMIDVVDRNKFATGSTLLIDVASAPLNGSSFTLEGINNIGVAFSETINFGPGPAPLASTFSLGGSTYDIYNLNTPRTELNGDEMKYQQLMDVMSMIITNTPPVNIAGAGTAAEYDAAIALAVNKGEVSFTADSKLEYKDKINSNTQAKFSMYDTNSGDFTAPASLMTFNTNNAVMVRDPKTDFFDVIDQMITSVENYTLYPDSTSVNVRNIGIENAIAMMDDLTDHVLRAHAQSGAQSTALTSAVERTSILEISAMTLRSSVIDTDLAKASLTLSQVTINYEAMLSTVGRVSKLNLVNYL